MKISEEEEEEEGELGREGGWGANFYLAGLKSIICLCFCTLLQIHYHKAS